MIRQARAHEIQRRPRTGVAPPRAGSHPPPRPRHGRADGPTRREHPRAGSESRYSGASRVSSRAADDEHSSITHRHKAPHWTACRELHRNADFGTLRAIARVRGSSAVGSKQRGHPERSAARARAGRRGVEGSREFAKGCPSRIGTVAGIARGSSLRVGQPRRTTPTLRSE